MSHVIEINQSGRGTHSRIPTSRIQRVVRETLKAIRYKNSSISIAFISPQRIRKINKLYRGCDAPTDVLAFQYRERVDTPRSKNEYWGEILICPTVAKRQAKLSLNTYLGEIEHLLVHGVLHLAGYDHYTKNESDVMFRLTSRVLSRLKK